MNAYSDKFKNKVIQNAQQVGLVKAAKLNHVSPQSVVTWCHNLSISFKRVSPTKACLVCGNVFKYHTGDYRLCCSKECRSKYEHESRVCLKCGKQFMVIRSSQRKYCSHECYALSNRKDNQERKRRGSNWNTIRRQFKKSPCQCEMCGLVMATDLHHIIPFKYFNSDWERANAETNIIALCQNCHHKAERYIRRVFKVIGVIERAD